jgi:predicted amidohydrolase
MRNKLTIAIGQSLITADIKRNSLHLREMMMEASRAGARLIHFPEGALSGYVKSQIQSWESVDWNLLEDELLQVMQTAKRLGIWVIVGCNQRLTPPNRPHNSLFVISDQGELVSRYDKRFCSHSEITDWYSSGRDPQVFSVDGFRMGCALCIEIQFPEVFSEYERLDADCVLFSAYSQDPMFWTQAQGHAASNNIWLSVSVPAQCGNTMQGGLIGPHGYGLSRCNASTTPHIQLAELNKEAPDLQIALTKARPWRRLARAGDIYRSSTPGNAQSLDQSCF